MPLNPEPYEVDDRGNVAQFYCSESGDIIATLDREYGEAAGDSSFAHSWDGDEDVTKWAVANGYEEVLEAKQIQ